MQFSYAVFSIPNSSLDKTHPM